MQTRPVWPVARSFVLEGSPCPVLQPPKTMCPDEVHAHVPSKCPPRKLLKLVWWCHGLVWKLGDFSAEMTCKKMMKNVSDKAKVTEITCGMSCNLWFWSTQWAMEKIYSCIQKTAYTCWIFAIRTSASTRICPSCSCLKPLSLSLQWRWRGWSENRLKNISELHGTMLQNTQNPSEIKKFTSVQPHLLRLTGCASWPPFCCQSQCICSALQSIRGTIRLECWQPSSLTSLLQSFQSFNAKIADKSANLWSLKAVVASKRGPGKP